jgi:hypothetical protein
VRIIDLPDNWLDTSPNLKPAITTAILAGIPARNVNKHTCVCTCVFACIERSSWLDPGRDHGDELTLIIVEKSWPVLRVVNNKLLLVTWSNQTVPI